MKKNVPQIIFISLLVALIISLLSVHDSFLKNFVINFFYAAVFSIINFAYFNMFSKKNLWEQNPKRSFWMAMAGMIPLNILVFFVLNLITGSLILGMPLENVLARQNAASYFMVVLIACVIALFIITLHLLNEKQTVR